MQIDFQTSEMMSFYYLWQESLMSFDSPELGDFLNSFENPQMKKITQTYPRGIQKHLASLGQEIQNGKIKNIDDFVSRLDSAFPKYAAGQGAVLKEVFTGYHQFFEASQPLLQKNLEVMKQLQDDGRLGYRQELGGLYAMFGVNPREDGLRAYINPAPSRPLFDGMSPNSTFYQNFSMTALPGEQYIENSTVGAGKISTPLHEATHHIFARSQLKKDLDAGNVRGRAKEVMEVIDAYMKAAPDKQPRGATALSALDEAFAACSSAVVYQKANNGRLPDEWYHGFDAANRLAPKIYPLYREYMAQGKTLDTEFFASLSQKLGSFRIAADKSRCAAAGGQEQSALRQIPRPAVKSPVMTGKNFEPER